MSPNTKNWQQQREHNTIAEHRPKWTSLGTRAHTQAAVYRWRYVPARIKMATCQWESGAATAGALLPQAGSALRLRPPWGHPPPASTSDPASTVTPVLPRKTPPARPSSPGPVADRWGAACPQGRRTERRHRRVPQTPPAPSPNNHRWTRTMSRTQWPPVSYGTSTGRGRVSLCPLQSDETSLPLLWSRCFAQLFWAPRVTSEWRHVGRIYLFYYIYIKNTKNKKQDTFLFPSSNNSVSGCVNK